MMTGGHNNSYGFTSFVGAFNGVKQIMNNLSTNPNITSPPKAPLSPQAQKQMKSLTNTLEKFKIQTPETHLGLLLTYSDSHVGPISNPDLQFQWFRHDNISAPISISAAAGVGVSSSSSSHNGWYAPSADDIGSIIRLRCIDSHHLGVLREYDSEIIQPDPELIHRVEEAICKDRITSKVILSSVPHGHQLNSSSSSSPNDCELDDFEIAGSIEIGSKGILLCEKGVESSGLRFYPSPAIEVRCYHPSSLIVRIPVPMDRNNSLITWIGKAEGSLFVQLESYLGTPNAIPDPLAAFQDTTQFLEFMVSCRDRLVRDSLVLSIRCLAAFVPSSVLTSAEAITRARLELLPWGDRDEEQDDSEEAVSLELFELQQTSETKEKIYQATPLKDTPREELTSASPRSTVYTRSLSCNDLSILLSPTKSVLSSPSSSVNLSLPLREREVSNGYGCESFFLADDDIITAMKHEITTLTDRCKRLAEENQLLVRQTNSSSSGDLLTPDLEQLFTQAQHLFQSSSQIRFSKEVHQEQEHERDSELSGTDSSEHSKDEESSQKILVQSLEKLFVQIQTKCQHLTVPLPLNPSVEEEKDRLLLHSRCESLAQELTVAQLAFERQLKDQSEASEVKFIEFTSLQQTKQTEYENQIQQLQLAINTTQQQHSNQTQLTQQLRLEHTQLQSDHHQLMTEFNHLQEKYSSLEQRNQNLQQEVYELGDTKQHLMKQLSQSDGLRKQLTQMKSQFQNLNQELMTQNEVISEKQTNSEKLILQQNILETEINLLKRCNEKLCGQVDEMKIRIDELENGMLGIENQKKSLMKENHRLRSGMNELFIEKKRLDEIEPLYTQQLTVLATNHSRYSELEIVTQRLEQNRNENVVSIVATEIRYGILEKRYRKLLEQFHQVSMISEDSLQQRCRLEAEVVDKNYKIKLLKQDLTLSKQAEPFVVKKLNYLLSKEHGEKNHFQNKVRSHSSLSLPLAHPLSLSLPLCLSVSVSLSLSLG
jgi:hypothetical protein